MRLIAIEEHFVSPGFVAGPGKRMTDELVSRPGEYGRRVFEKLEDVGDKRIAEMDAAGIDVQVLSLLAPGVEQAPAEEQPALARESNDFLAEAVKRNPKRFAGFAALPTAQPEVAADELEARVSRQGFKGALINGHTHGRYLDDKFFWPILERAEALNVPIYLHPTFPVKPVVDAIYSGLSPAVSHTLASHGWGWHIETGLHLIRVILGGVFDKYPKLQFMVGHLGEGVPFMFQRLARNFPVALTGLAHPMDFYLRNNVYYTFGGFNFPATFLDLFLEVGAERIIFSADHPYGSMAEASTFLSQLPVGREDRERIAHGNAERLLNL